ncbi:hypothetical protein LSH36_120g04031 [Paralvinella palmiformis]|uniref:DBC1/CARP1 catalytically inactive NUDIX hydrolase domain-containing protein n=1 Tax=Paralvinella palmiformis TaxID=53620 RepID=A0AAD9NAM0_9ANNE|nr:hypothetical protein LSH36_120g04031 [Paralvinella palmiformis]
MPTIKLVYVQFVTVGTKRPDCKPRIHSVESVFRVIEMAQFSAGKNPPWAREPALSQPGVANLTPPQVGLANTVLTQPALATPTVYSLGASQPTIAPHHYTAQQLGVANIQANAGAPPPALQQAVQLPQPGIAIPTTLATTQVATISYPTPRPPVSGAGAPPLKQQRVFTGTVTKLHDNFGFVDEDVFFQTSCVKGVIPKVGDRVLVEASYNANMPFKWNAARIQVLPNQSNAPSSQSSFVQSQPTFTQNSVTLTQSPAMTYQMKPTLGSNLTPSVIPPTNMTQPPPLMSQPAQPTGPKRDKSLLQTAQGRSSLVQSRRMENQGFRDRDRGRDRDRTERHTHDRRERRSPRKRSRSPRRSKSPSSRGRSPQRRRQQARIVPRYMVQIPKLSLDCSEANVITLKSRYSNLYIPSDFFNAAFTWVDGFPLHRPFQLGNSCTFHVMSKEVEPINKADTNLEPSDADHLYSAKVMLLSSPTLEEIYHKSCALTEDPSEVREAFKHPTRLVQFLVGMKGKSEPMAIGGPWSPSLDGPNPAEDPRVLINTAIRTTRSLTGIDLSRCTQWYRFTEIRYHRPEEMHKGRLVPARVETVVIFLPDVWSCSPTHLEWDQLQAAYRQQLQDKLAEEGKEDTQALNT